jgi:acyl-CoA-dependent ceramide synthase
MVLDLILPYGRGDGTFAVGVEDLKLVALFSLVWIGVRWMVQKLLIRPLALWCKVRPQEHLKAEEAGWFFCYDACFWTWGLTLLIREPGWFGTARLWEGYPLIWLQGDFKLYYILQFAFWVSSVWVLLVEKRRKDFFQMLMHHFVTILLVCSSFFTGWTKLGHLILVELDCADILLYLSKVFRYFPKTKYNICNACFGLFVIVWVITRHGFYPITIWEWWFTSPTVIEMKWDPANGHFYDWRIRATIIAMVTLEILMLIWLKAIIGVLQKALARGVADDSRSDSDEDEPSDSKKPLAHKKTPEDGKTPGQTPGSDKKGN